MLICVSFSSGDVIVTDVFLLQKHELGQKEVASWLGASARSELYLRIEKRGSNHYFSLLFLCILTAFVITEGIELVPHVGNTDPAAAAAAKMPSNFVASEKDPRKVVEQCRQTALEELTMIPHSPDDIISRMKECVEIGVSASLLRVNDEIEFHSALRTQISTQLENHTCTDETLGTSPDVETRDWISDKDGKSRTVHVKLGRPASRIHVVENFASVDECNAMEETAAPKLHAASVADGKGGIQYSQNRKALQAGITPKWEEEENGDLVARLSRRVYEYTNYELGLNLSEKGQEPLMSIQYFGRGYNDTEPDRYTPHCDGVCNGEPHRYGTRMATMVIYCNIPERGGHTNFQSAGVHIKPVELSAIFFSYIDPATNLTDKGLTTHSGCPVYEGEKKIITQWVRYGVTADVPWGAYNTLGILKTEAGG